MNKDFVNHMDSVNLSKTRAKNFSKDEIMSMVDLLEENKSNLFGAYVR